MLLFRLPAVFLLRAPRPERRNAGEPVRTVVRPKDRRPRPKRWADAVDQLRTLQAEYETWRDQLPEALADSRTAELLEGVCATSTSTPSTSSCRGASAATEMGHGAPGFAEALAAALAAELGREAP